MSHIVKVKTSITDVQAIKDACKSLELPAPVHGTHKVYSTEATGWGVSLTGWRFPVVCNTETGEVKYDNCKGSWGHKDRLTEFQQQYSIERMRRIATENNHTFNEERMKDGRVRLTIVDETPQERVTIDGTQGAMTI